MQSANQKPGKLGTLSQHAVEANSQIGKARHTIPTYTARINLYKKGAKAQNSGQEEQLSKQLQHLRRVGKRHDHRTASAEPED